MLFLQLHQLAAHSEGGTFRRAPSPAEIGHPGCEL